ncbi:MAG: hypothetical protein LBB47_01585, partial [Spirochaetaceae bacterium]|nr:hypothetical protein [Spirochaetaceae bacterium]
MKIVTGIENNRPECMEKPCSRCPCMDFCPLEKAMNLIGGKWRLSILCALHSDGTTRYNELKR